ncbi:non-ribosomal peptide synthetase [Thozetella sp. PMI_491]|nr:non-ribosomal peptide synthetase [Thozetella sp. PMI_491]
MDTALPAGEAQLSITNHPAARLPGPSLLHRLVHTSSEDQHPAVDYLGPGGTRVSLRYDELHAASDRLARRISYLTSGTAKDKQFVVPVLIPQSPELYIALLAILKAGGAFCPLNLDIPPERASFILNDVSADIVLVASNLVSRIPNQEPRRIILVVDDEDDTREMAGLGVPEHREPQPADLAYVMYTSGSTGMPKGVGISHASATQSLLAHDRFIPEFSKFFQFAAPTFDVSVFEIFFPLFRGKTLASSNRHDTLNDLPGVLRTLDADACELTPTVAGSLLRKRANVPCLRLLLTIGEMLTEPVVKEFGGSEGYASMLWAMYGPTEAAIHCTLQPAASNDTFLGNIGVPLDTVSAFVLKIQEESQPGPSFEVVPKGQIGELAVGGFQLAEGYINRPEQTLAAFIDTPYGRLYRTGDKARMRPDGTLECLGRISDGQIKLRGQRIELGEIEQAALRATGCHTAVAAVIDGILVAFCASDAEPELSLAAIRQSCRDWLPGYMVPGDIVVAVKLPRLASGKVDRKQLIASYRDSKSSSRGSDDIQFKDEIERQICKLAQDVLGRDVDPSVVLLSAGMDSITSIRFTSVLRGAGFHITAAEVMAARTISSLHDRIVHQAPSDLGPVIGSDFTASPKVDIRQLGEESSLLRKMFEKAETIFPCTPVQTSMLFETMSNRRAYCNWTELQLPAHHNADTVVAWFQTIAQANPILRSGFFHHEGIFFQAVFGQLDASQILTCFGTSEKEFEIESDVDFLRPFRIHLLAAEESEKTTLLLQMHHALYDGWSMDILLADLEELIRGHRLPERPQFRDVIEYYDSAAYRASCDVAREFWAGNLAGIEPATLPKLLSEIPQRSEVRSTVLDLNLSPEDVRTTLQQLECTPQVLFLASITWLWRYLVGSDDVVVGSVTSGRTIPILGIEDIIGPCLSIIPLRTNFAQAARIQDVMRSIQAAIRLAVSHSMLPLADIKKAAGIAAGQPLYHLLFVYQESLVTKTRKLGEVLQVAHQDYLETKLLVEVEPAGDKFRCRITHHTDAFPEAQVRYLGDQLQYVARHVLHHWDAQLQSMESALPQPLLSLYNHPPVTFSGVPDLAHSVEAIASCFPGKPALCFAASISDTAPELVAQTVSFDELNSLANRLAWHLKQRGAQPDGIIAIVMEKSVLLYAGILAIVKLGCAYMPLLPSTPKERLVTIFGDSRPSICVCDTASATDLRQLTSVECVDIQSLNLAPYLDENPQTAPDPSRLAYIIYTSGSTGVPKGVCVTQNNITSNLDILSKIYPVKETSRLLQSCSQAFDVSVFEIFFAWTQAMCLCSATNDVIFADLERSIRTLGVTHLSMTPTVASLLDPSRIPSVEFLVTSGEAMTEIVARKWTGLLYQGYGPSETTNICTVKHMGPNQVIQHLGWSFDNTSTFVLFRDSINLAPIGCVGELCFGGDQVAHGYLNNSDLTESKFIQHPEYGRMYRSGDLGRMLPDGSLVVLGRVDDQVKLRGQRVELNEVTASIREFSSVREGVTLLISGTKQLPDQLISFYVPNEPDFDHNVAFEILGITGRLESSQNELYRSLCSRLPSYMLPSYLIPISTLPMTSSGKLDRRKLIEIFRTLDRDYLEVASSLIDTTPDDSEWTEMEAQIVEILSATFDTTRLQRWTPLITIGLDSISAIRAARDIEKHLGKKIPISAILQNPSVAKLSQAILELTPQPATPEENSHLVSEEVTGEVRAKYAKVGKPVERILPCTPLQQGMLAASSGGTSYLNHTLLRLYRDWDLIQTAWDAMRARHSIFRTSFSATNDPQTPVVQVILEDHSAAWKTYDASHSSMDKSISAHIATVAGAVDSFEPPISSALITCGSDKYLSFVCHHAIYDGVAMERILFEVEELISGETFNSEPDYGLFLRQMLSIPPSAEQFWKRLLSGYNPRALPRPPSTAYQARPAVFESASDMRLSTIHQKLPQYGVSLQSLCQATWAACLGVLLRSQDICFGTVISGRSVAIDRIDELVAPCFNTVPVRINLSDMAQNMGLVQAFYNLNLRILEHQFTPLRYINSLVGKRDSKDWRLFDTLLILQQPRRVLKEEIWTLERDDGIMDFPLVCEITPDSELDQLNLKLHSDGYYNPEMLEAILSIFSHVLERILEVPASAVPAIESLPDRLQKSLESLPLTQEAASSGTEAIVNGNHAIEAWDEVESKIRAVISKLSSTPEYRISRETSIYELGLDSINAVQIAAMLREQGLDANASDVIEAATCERLGARLNQTQVLYLPDHNSFDLKSFRREVSHQVGQLEIDFDCVENSLPSTPLQTAMLAQFLLSGGSDYLNFIDFQLLNKVKLSALLEGWHRLWAMHSMLRTGFVQTDRIDCSFAMIQYHPGSTKPPVAFTARADAPMFNLDTWRAKVSEEIFQELHRPLWRVMCVENESGMTAHLAIHHALYDASSVRSMLNDLVVAVRGKPLPKPPSVEACVLDILEQNAYSNTGAEAFWKSRLETAVVNKFPLMTPLKESQRRILVENLRSAKSFSSLEQASRSTKYPLQAIFQAAWARVLSSYLGEQSVTFGVVLSGRNSPATQNAVFPCITTLPVVASTVGSNKGLLDQMLDFNAEAYRYQHTSLSRVQQWSDSPQTRLFDTILVYQKLESTPKPPEWQVIDEKATVDYSISIEIEPMLADELEYRVTFFSDVLPPQQAQLILQQLDAIVWDLALHSKVDSSDLSSIPRHLLSVVPPRRRELPSSASLVHELVETQAQRTPNHVALHFVENILAGEVIGRTWSYRDLDHYGNRVARLLQPHVGVGDTVAIHFEKCPEAFFSMLGILKAGCGFLALDPSAPTARKTFILQDANVSALLTSENHLPALDLPSGVTVLTINEVNMSNESAEPVILERPVLPSDICYCLYTSGTTGVPKGCEITHENVVQCMLAFQDIFAGHWDDRSRWLQFASFHFDVSVLEQYWSWSVGITLISASRDLILDDLAGTISTLQITHIDLTPSLARLLHPDDVPSLCRGVFITGGESLTQEILDDWGEKAVIYNFYGPTEATIGVTVYPRVPRTGRPSNIGWPFINVGAYVLSPGTQEPVLKGAVGELCVSGKLVGRGYLGRQELTAERFPTLDKFGERVYRTGDLVRLLHDGCIDFLGRADDQVKLRGQRLEIGEINHTIKTRVEEIRDTATVVVHNEKQEKSFLVSFVVTNTNHNSSIPLTIIEGAEAAEISQKIKDACRSRLPGYMVPTYVLQLPFIPLSSNNKAEIKELKKLFNTLSHEQLIRMASHPLQSTAPLDSTSEKIIAALATMTSIDTSSITPASSIFELGIDSITVLQFARLLKKNGLFNATPSAILKHHRIADLASIIGTEESSKEEASISAANQLIRAYRHQYGGLACSELGVTAADIQYIAPCSALQQGMTSRSLMDGAYFNVFRFKLGLGISTSSLHDAWQNLVDECDILRTVFLMTQDGHIQIALASASLPWTQVDFQGEEALEEMLSELYKEWISKNNGNIINPLELILVKSDDARVGNQLVVHMFHGIYDANSFELMMNRILDLCSAGEEVGNTETSGSVEAPSFLDALQHGPLRNLSSCRPFWTEHLKGARHQSLPAIEEKTTSQAVQATITISFNPLEPLLAALGITHQAVVQAAWVSVLAKHLISDPTIGIIVSGRSIDLDGVENTIGPLFNTIPFYAGLGAASSRDLTWNSLLRRCHDFNTTILPFQHVPLRDIQKWCSRGRPLFDTLFSFQRMPLSTPTGKKAWVELETSAVADYPLALEVTLSGTSQLQLTLVAQNTVGNFQSLSELLNEMRAAMELMAQGPNGRVYGGQSPTLIAPETNGTSLPMQNGSANMKHPSEFTWTPEAVSIRKEIAILAEIAPDDIGEGTSVLELGLDSIDAIKLASRLSKMGIKLSTSEIMRQQTIANMTKLPNGVANGEPVKDKSVELNELSSRLRADLEQGGFDLHDFDNVLPTTPLQDSMVSEMVQSNFRQYFNHEMMEISTGVDPERLLAAWESVVANSPILRTVFLPVESPHLDIAYCQAIETHQKTSIERITLNNEDGIDKIMETATRRAKEAAGRAHLLQLTLANIKDRHFLVLSIAHALYDGWSLDMLHHDVQAAYHGHLPKRASYEPLLGHILSSSTRVASDFWSRYLDGAQPTLIAAQKQPSASEDSVHGQIEFSSAVSFANVKAFCREHAISLQVLGQASWAAVLAAKNHSLDVTFGVVLLGRNTEAEEELMFPAMNTVAVRSVLHGSIAGWLRYMQENMSSIAEFQHFPLRKAQRLAGSTSGPLFNTLFIQQRRMHPLKDGEEASLAKSVRGSASIDYPACLEMEVSDEELIWRLGHDNDYLTNPEASSLLRQLDVVLDFIIQAPGSDLLHVTGSNVTVCGLPPFQVAAQVSSSLASDSKAQDTGVWSPTEDLIRAVLSDVSGAPVSSIRRTDNVYNLGLDSISAIKASSVLRKRGIVLGPRDMARSRSISEMAELASRGKENGVLSGSNLIPPQAIPIHGEWPISADEVLSTLSSNAYYTGLEPSLIEEVLPATPMQVHMLSVWQNTNGQVFQPDFSYLLEGILDKDRVMTAWRALVTEQPILRTIFVPTHSREAPLFQIVLRPGRDNETPFASLRISREGQEGCLVHLKIHHALYDGVSLPVLMDRFAELLSGAHPQQRDNNAALWRGFCTAPFSETAKLTRGSFWTSYLANAPSSVFPRLNQKPKADSRVSLVQRAVFTVSTLVPICAKHGISLQAMFLAVYSRVLGGRIAGSTEPKPQAVVFGIYLANRSTEDVTGLPYPTLRLVPLKVDTSKLEDILGSAKRIQEDIHDISSLANVDAGLWEIKDWTGLSIDSFVNFLSLPASDGSKSGDIDVVLRPVDAGYGTSGMKGTANSDQILALEGNPVRDAYPDAVDLEASVQGESMDIGVFGSSDVLDEQSARDIISELTGLLAKIE